MNNVAIIGRIVNDLEVRKVGQDLSFLSFTIAVNDRYGSNEESSFFDVKVWNRQAETIATYFRKGQRIGITGRLKQERFQDKEGKNRNKIVIVLGGFDFIEPKDFGNNTADTAPGEAMNTPPSKSTKLTGNNTGNPSSSSSEYDFPNFPEDQSFEDDEVPF